MAAFDDDANVFAVVPDDDALFLRDDGNVVSPLTSEAENVLLSVSREMLYEHNNYSFAAKNYNAPQDPYRRLYASLEYAWKNFLEESAHDRLFKDYVALADYDASFSEKVERPVHVERANVFLLISHLQSLWVIANGPHLKGSHECSSLLARIVHFAYHKPSKLVRVYQVLHQTTKDIFANVIATIGDQTRYVDDSYKSVDVFKYDVSDAKARKYRERFVAPSTSEYVKNGTQAAYTLTKPAVIQLLGAHICRNDNCAAILLHDTLVRDLLVLFTVYSLLKRARTTLDFNFDNTLHSSKFMLTNANIDWLLPQVEARYREAKYHELPMIIDASMDVDTFRLAWCSFVEEFVVTGIVIHTRSAIDEDAYAAAIRNIIDHAPLLRRVRYHGVAASFVEKLIAIDPHVEIIDVTETANRRALSTCINIQGVNIEGQVDDETLEHFARMRIRKLQINQVEQSGFLFKDIAAKIPSLIYVRMHFIHASDNDLQLFLRAFNEHPNVRELSWYAAQSPDTQYGTYHALKELIAHNRRLHRVDISVAAENAEILNDYLQQPLAKGHPTIYSLDVGYTEDTPNGREVAQRLSANLDARVDFIQRALH